MVIILWRRFPHPKQETMFSFTHMPKVKPQKCRLGDISLTFRLLKAFLGMQCGHILPIKKTAGYLKMLT